MKTDAPELEPDAVKERATTAKAVELRIQGHDWATIARQIGSTPRAARALVIGALRDFDLRTEDGVEELRDVTAARYERMISRVWPVAFPTEKLPDGTLRAAAPNLDAVGVLLGIMRDEAKFLGLGTRDKIVIDVAAIEEDGNAAIRALLGFIPPDVRQLALESLELMRRGIGNSQNTIVEVATEAPGSPEA